MTTRIIIFVGFFLFSISCFAQSIDSEVISSHGGEYTIVNTDIIISATTGEAVSESTILNLNFHSGFQQGPRADIANIKYNPIIKNYWTISPNPGNGQFQISNSNPLSFKGTSLVEIFDTQGRIIFNYYMEGSSDVIDLTMHSAGLYFIRIHDKTQLVCLPVVRANF